MKCTRLLIVLASMLLAAFMLAGCASSSSPAATSTSKALSEFEKADMSGYACMTDYDKDTVFVSMTVDDVLRKMDEGASFTFYMGFPACGWCNVMLTTLNDQALEHNVVVGYVNTRANPEWKNNTEIDDYDKFVERFGSELKVDDAGNPHLYVPHVFFIKDGKLVDNHAGTVEGQTSPDQQLTSDQKQTLADTFDKGFTAVES